jgi:DNA polymerase III delta prime subunit
LAKGDLRKAINLLQSVSMQNSGMPLTVSLCYDTAGVPSNQEVDKILSTLINRMIDFNEANTIIVGMIKNQGYSLSIVLKEIVLKILLDENILKDMPQILSDLSDLENMVTKSTFGDIYITALVGIFKKN